MSDRFDPAKDAANRAKHGLPLSFGDKILQDIGYVVVESIRPEDFEQRLKVIGQVDTKLYTGVFVWRDSQRRFISVRRSNDAEERAYRNSG
jgi:uncharacterized DUF497 family protein